MEKAPQFDQALVFTGGGTGGHYYPAVALAEGARTRWPELPIVFVGARRGIEAIKLPESSWPYMLLDVEGLMGRSPLALLRGLWKLAKARRTLMGCWRRTRPAAVVGTGGYGAAPALLAARAMGIPYFIHESNAAPGALIKQVSAEARRVWCGMTEAQKAMPNADCATVGTPVRDAFLRPFLPLDTDTPPFRLLVLGGSGGARALNEAVFPLAFSLLERFPTWEILHQTGARDFGQLQELPRHPRHQVAPFLEDVDQALERASLVISRSGASTCAELKACGRPALLVPFPEAAANHQHINAMAMAQEGRARVIPQGPDLATRLMSEAEHLMVDPTLRHGMAKPEANMAVTRCLDELGKMLEAAPSSGPATQRG